MRRGRVIGKSDNRQTIAGMPFDTRSLAAAMLAACTTTAYAVRPMTTDDAAVADTGTCQIEAWYERDRRGHAIVANPACGAAKGLEIGAGIGRDRTDGESTTVYALGAKWVPESGRFGSPLGTLDLGLRVATTRAHGHASDHGVFLLATLEAAPKLAVHVNAGVVRDAVLHVNGTLLFAALAWSAGERTLLFAEALASDRSAVFGGAVRTVGARWWLVKDTLGLDFTASKQAGSDSGTRWGIGFGWYGIFGDR